MKRVLGISLLAIVVGLTGCSSEETSSKEKGSATEIKTEPKVQNRDDVKLADNEILVINEKTGKSEKLEAEADQNEKLGLTFKFPAYYSIKEDSAENDGITINAPYSSYITLFATPLQRDMVNKPTFDTYLGSSYNHYSKDNKITKIDIANSKDSFVRDNFIYLVEFNPKSESYKKMYGGLVQIGDVAYEFMIALGNNDYSDEVYETTLGILAAAK